MHWVFRNMIICTLLALGVFTFIFYSETNTWPLLDAHWMDYLIVLVLGNAGGGAVYLLSIQINKYFPWNKRRPLRFIADVFSGLVIFLLLSLVFVNFYLEFVIPVEDFFTFWEEYWDGAVKLGILLFVLLYVYSLVSFSVYSYNHYAYSQIEMVRIEKDQLNLQFEALKSQLNPHFLFNALNTILSLIYRDIMVSEEFIRKLADTYNYILKTDDRKLIELSEEISMAESYYFMQQIKYEDFINLKISVSEDLMNTLIPPLTIQMLLENAFKHNLISEKEKLDIEIFNEDEKYLVVKNNFLKKPELLKIGNNLVERPENGNSHKLGLENIRKRYKYFGNKDIEVNFDEYFTVKLPVINKSN